jgi:predicted RNase H-like HicB family nuclease
LVGRAHVADADYERDEDGWWLATVAEVAGCHTQARTVDEARARIREALVAAGATDAETAELVDAP